MKPTLLYVSPFWPQKSGISEYSESLIWGLKEFFDITIVTKIGEIQNELIEENFEIQVYKRDKDYSGYDYIIYNFGNSPHNHDYMYDMLAEYSGYVILHDYTLFYLSVMHYREQNRLFQEIYAQEGIRGIITAKESIKEKRNTDLIQHKNLPPLLPLNQEVLRNAKGIFVHSNYVKEKIQEKNPNIKVYKIELVDCMPDVELDEEDYLREKYGMKQDDFIIGAVGMIAPTKQNEIACQAVNLYNKTHDKAVKYVMIGEGDYVDSYLNENIIKMGFLENKDFFNAVKSCDAVFNLRYPYNGESSATLMQCMLMGKHCVVTDIGWFGELSDECVKKVAVDISVEELVDVIENIRLQDVENEKGIKFVQEKCNAKAIVQMIYECVVEGRESYS